MAKSKSNVTDLFYYLLPILVGLALTITFPDGAIKAISYFYGSISSMGEMNGEKSVFLSRYVIFIILISFFSCWIVIRIIKWWRGITLRVGFWGSLMVALLFPFMGYSYVATDIFNSINVTTGMYLTVFRNDPEHLRRLLKIGGDPNRLLDNGNEQRYTLLMIAASNGNEEIVRELLQNGADRNARSLKGEKAIDFAHKKNHQSIEKVLASN